MGGSLAVLLGTFTVPPVRDFLSLVMPTPFGWALVGGGAIMAVVMSHVLASPLFARPAMPRLLAAPTEKVALAQVEGYKKGRGTSNTRPYIYVEK